MIVRAFQESDASRWDDFVCNHPEASPYHLSAWTAAVRKAYGFESHNLIAEQAGEVRGVLPLVKMSFPLMKPSYVALPYCDVGGVLANSPEDESCLIDFAVSKVRLTAARLIEFRGELSIGDVSQNQAAIYHTPTGKARMVLDLPKTRDELWASYKSKLRSQVRKAEKNGLVFEFGNDRVAEFYSVFSKNMRDLGSPVHSRKWFEEVMINYGNNAKIGLVLLDQKVVGGALILKAGEKISIPWASTLREYNRLSPNMLLYWELLKYSINIGAIQFDFGRSTPGEGTFKFKSQWGATPRNLKWYRVNMNDRSNVKGVAIFGGRQTVEWVWKKMPLPIANIIGHRIRKYISL
jgi:FemAB-related protein (PEP-CTERM system-associated)